MIEDPDQVICPYCHYEHPAENFSEGGKYGCQQCYNTFGLTIVFPFKTQIAFRTVKVPRESGLSAYP